MSQYGKLVTLSTKYAQRMSRLSNQIFGNQKKPGSFKDNKIINLFKGRPVYEDPYIVDYYPRHIETGLLMKKLREYGLYRDEHKDFADEMKRLRALRGKVKERKFKPKAE